MNIASIIQLITALEPFVVATEQAVMGALRGAGAITDAQADADMLLLVQDALAAKAQSDAAAAGHDPQ